MSKVLECSRCGTKVIPTDGGTKIPECLECGSTHLTYRHAPKVTLEQLTFEFNKALEEAEAE